MKGYRKYIGTKVVEAKPMTAQEAISLGYRVDEEEDGYEVVYENGYKSWSPSSAFGKAYRHVDGMSFGLAIEALKGGKKVSREGWNGKGMWLKLVEPYSDMSISDEQSDKVTEGSTLSPYIGMKTANNEFVPWLASQTDVLSEDWGIIEEQFFKVYISPKSSNLKLKKMGKMIIEAYNVKAKKKEPMLKAVIDKNGNRYFAKGESKDGQKLCVAMGAEKVNLALKEGVAKKGEGWD